MRTIAQISDLHFGRHSLQVCQDLHASIAQSQPDLVALSGDFTQRARHAEFAEARRFLDAIAAPKLVVPGNHDVPLYNVFDRFLTPFAKYHHYVTPVGHPGGLFCDDELAVLGLNTARRFTRKNGRLSLEQIAEVGRVFREVPPRAFKVLVTHHPLALPSGALEVELAGRSRLALETIAAAGVHLLLSGHHHRALSGEATELGSGGSVLVVHAGTAISTRIRGLEANSYNLIRIAGERVSVTVMEWAAGQGFRKKRSVSFVLQENTWRTVDRETEAVQNVSRP
jgi:3',5'-cyclic AMP phosphodiesterase CpdA